MTKVCKTCEKELPLSSFYKNSHHDSYSGECKVCKVKRASDLAKTTRAEAIKMHNDKCAICGETYHHACYDFHHLDSTKKEGHPSDMLWKSKKKFFEEIKKCILVCSNCHRILHYEN